MAVVNNLNTDFLITTKMNPSANITLQSATVDYVTTKLVMFGK